MKRKVEDDDPDFECLPNKQLFDDLLSFDWQDSKFAPESSVGTEISFDRDVPSNGENSLAHNKETLPIVTDPLSLFPLPSILSLTVLSNFHLPHFHFIPSSSPKAPSHDNSSNFVEKGMKVLCEKFLQHYNEKKMKAVTNGHEQADSREIRIDLDDLERTLNIRTRRVKELLKFLEIFQVV
jgi:hypothetical protein